MSIDPRLLEVIGAELNVDANRIEPDSGPEKEDIEEWDSFAHVTLVLAVEQTFGVKCTAEEIPKLNTPAKLESWLMDAGAL
jgi:acyl carrier protein